MSASSLMLFGDSFEKIGNVIFKNKKVRNATIIVNAISVGAGLLLLTYLSIYGSKEQIVQFYDKTSIAFAIIPILTLASLGLAIVSGVQSVVDKELDKIHVEREKITTKIEQEETPDIFDTIQLSLNKIDEYYAINQGQARSSFRFCIAAVVVGLITIVAGIWFYYFKVRDIQIAYITGFSGVLLEFIGGAYFFIYKKSVEQVNFFFGQLIRIQDTMVAINLAKNMGDEEKRAGLIEKIVVSLLERSLK